MRRVMYLFLPGWPIDRLRRLGSVPSLSSDAPADEAPFATVVAAGGRRLIAAVNPAAAAAGLAPGMALADALSFLPALAAAPAESQADAAALTRLAEWCTRYSPWTAPDGIDGIKIEVTGCAHLWGGEAALVADLARRLERLQIAQRIAIAGTLGAAWALARFAAAGDRPALPPSGEERAALAPLPVEALRLDPATAAGLRRIGLKRIGELYPMPRDALARRFGESVARRLDQAWGDLPEPLSPLGEAPVRRVRLSFAEPIADPADLARAIERLALDLVTRLAREGMGARRLGLAFHRIDGRVEHIRLGTARPSRDPHHLAGLLAAKLDTVDPGLGVEDMILALFTAEKLAAEQIKLPPLPPQENPLPPSGGEGRVRGAAPKLQLSPPHPNPLPHWGRGGRFAAGEGWDGGIAPLLDRLGARLGLAAIGRLEARESHIPERASVAVPIEKSRDANPCVIPGRRATANPEPMSTGLWNMGSGFRPAVGSGMTRKGSAGNTAKPPRPVRLFAPPEPIVAVWLLPDDPPFRFTWRRRPYRVRRADGPERIAEEWWTAPSCAVGAIRDYYRVEDEEGRRFWLFRAGPPGNQPPRWFVHGLFA
ncbi:MAG TPA: DNA polymerase Y family protein [Stellaceae bacterium]|nr:DNA polymerase Y family protein [Stellaceae bacterium]